MRYEHYTQLADLFDFPGTDYFARGQKVLAVLRETFPAAALEVERFLSGVPRQVLDLQELYTRTFDVQAITTLDIGYVLFGDDYKRAELLSNLTREHRQVENDCHGELADHLPNMLRLIPRLASFKGAASGGDNLELVHELVREILAPALMLMIREFDSERILKKNASYRKHYKTLIVSAPGEEFTVYCRALSALLQVLREDFPVEEVITRLSDWSTPGKSVESNSADCMSVNCKSGCGQHGNSASADFLGFIEKEMEIEMNANPVNSGCDS